MGCPVTRRPGYCGCFAMFLIGILGGFSLSGISLQLNKINSDSDEFRVSASAGGLAAAPPQRRTVIPQQTMSPLTIRPQAAPEAVDDMDTFEPHLVKDPPSVVVTDEKFSRPRFYSTELGTRRKLYVAVLTSPDTVHKEAKSINHTLAHVTRNIGFYMAGDTNMPLPKNLHNVVVFSTEDQSSLALKAAEYLADHHGDLYDYFFVVRDSAYVRGYRLQELVEDLSVSGDVLLGDADSQCRLAGGLLMSRQVLMSVAGRRSQCEERDWSAGQDRSLVTCLEQLTGLRCSDHAQGKVYASRPSADYDPAFSGDVAGLITVRDVHEAADANRLHAAFSRLEIHQIDASIGQLRQALRDNQQNLHALSRAKAVGLGDTTVDAGPEELPWPAGSAAPVRTTSRNHINTWQHFSQTHLYLRTPNSVKDPLSPTDNLDVQEVVGLAMVEVQKSGAYKLLRLRAGYRRFDGGRGMDYILELEVEPEGGGDMEVRRVEVHRPLLKAELVPMPFVTEKPTVTVVLPVTADQVQQAEQFVQNVISSNENLSLVLYLMAGDSSVEVFRPLVQMVQAANKRPAAAGRRMGWLTLMGNTTPSQFFIMDAVVKKVQGKQLILLLSQPGIEYDSELFNRARMQTIRGWEVFCPIPWVEYHPDIIYNGGVRGDKLEIHKNYGRFDGDFYGILSFYINDYVNMRNRTMAEIPYMEQSNPSADLRNQQPYDLYGAFVRHSDLHVHRAVDPSFRLLHFEHHCPANSGLFHQQACFNSMLEDVGSQQQLAEALDAFRESQPAF